MFQRQAEDPTEETSGKRRFRRGVVSFTEAEGGRCFPQVSVKGYRGIEKEED